MAAAVRDGEACLAAGLEQPFAARHARADGAQVRVVATHTAVRLKEVPLHINQDLKLW